MNTLEDSEVYHSLRRLEHVLNNRTETFINKVESLIEVWKQVQDCRLTEHIQYVMHLMDWLKLHTLNIVLTGDWKKCKDVYEERLLKEVKHCEMLLLHSNNIFSFRCKKLAEVIKDPWGSPTLGRLLNTPDLEIGAEEMEFFGMETGYLISTRLRKLCESHCEDLALNLVTAFMRFHQMAETQNFTINATEDQKRFILDVYIALLYKYKRTHLIISTLKSLTLTEGLDLLKRFAHKRVNISKIWRHSGRIAYLAAQVYMTAAVMTVPNESARILEGLLDTWLNMPETVEDLATLTATVRRIMQAADSAVHMYMFCKAFYKRFGGEMRTFIIELYIMALTTDINVLQRQKEELNEHEERESSERLAYGFLKLADVLDHNLKLCRESVLTAFSLKPSQAILDRIVSLAKATGYDVIPSAHLWKCDHPPSDTSDDVSYKCNKCGEYKSYLELQSSLNSNTTLSDAVSEELDLSPHLRDDLVVVLSSPRYHFLNWLGTWKNLYHLCVIYLSDPVKTKNIITELKYVDIDYSLFVGIKREPEDENANGIERGYEHYLEDNYLEACGSSDEQEKCANEMASGNFHLLPPPATKSDPNVLKSLRLFRPSLKRPKLNYHEHIPSKIFIPNPIYTSPLSFDPCAFNPHRTSSNRNLVNYNIFASCPNLPTSQMLNNSYGSSMNAGTNQDTRLRSNHLQNSIQKDTVLNLSTKDTSAPLPMDLSKHTIKENLSELHKNFSSTTGNNFARNRSAAPTRKKGTVSNTRSSTSSHGGNINQLCSSRTSGTSITHPNYHSVNPTNSKDRYKVNRKSAGSSVQAFQNKNDSDKFAHKSLCATTKISSKNSSISQHQSNSSTNNLWSPSSIGCSNASNSLKSYLSEENTLGINLTDSNSLSLMINSALQKHLHKNPSASKNALSDFGNNPEALVHEDIKALRKPNPSNLSRSPTVSDSLNSEEFQITLESLLEVKKNPVIVALEEKRRNLELLKVLFDSKLAKSSVDSEAQRFNYATSDFTTPGIDDDRTSKFSEFDEKYRTFDCEEIPGNTPVTIIIGSSPENSCDQDMQVENNSTEPNASTNDLCNDLKKNCDDDIDLNMYKNVLHNSGTSIIKLPLCQKQEPEIEKHSFCTDSQSNDIPSSSVNESYGTIRDKIEVKALPRNVKEKSYSNYGKPFNAYPQNLHHFLESSVEERRTILQRYLNVPNLSNRSDCNSNELTCIESTNSDEIRFEKKISFDEKISLPTSSKGSSYKDADLSDSAENVDSLPANYDGNVSGDETSSHNEIRSPANTQSSQSGVENFLSDSDGNVPAEDNDLNKSYGLKSDDKACFEEPLSPSNNSVRSFSSTSSWSKNSCVEYDSEDSQETNTNMTKDRPSSSLDNKPVPLCDKDTDVESTSSKHTQSSTSGDENSISSDTGEDHSVNSHNTKFESEEIDNQSAKPLSSIQSSNSDESSQSVSSSRVVEGRNLNEDRHLSVNSVEDIQNEEKDTRSRFEAINNKGGDSLVKPSDDYYKFSQSFFEEGLSNPNTRNYFEDLRSMAYSSRDAHLEGSHEINSFSNEVTNSLKGSLTSKRNDCSEDDSSYSTNRNCKMANSSSPLSNFSLDAKHPATCEGSDFIQNTTLNNQKLSKNCNNICGHDTQKSIHENNDYEEQYSKKDSRISDGESLACPVWPGLKVRSLDLGELLLMEADVPRVNISKEDEHFLKKCNEIEHNLPVTSVEISADNLLLKTGAKRKLPKIAVEQELFESSSSNESDQMYKTHSQNVMLQSCIPSSSSSDDVEPDEKRARNDEHINPNWYQTLSNLPFANTVQNFDETFFSFFSDDLVFKNKCSSNEQIYETNLSNGQLESLEIDSDSTNSNIRKKKTASIKETTKNIYPQSPLRRSTKLQDMDKNECELIKKYKLKEVRVVLYPLTYTDYTQDSIKLNESRTPKQKVARSGPRKMTKKSENLTKDKCRSKTGLNTNNNESKPWPLQDISPKVNCYKDIKSSIDSPDKSDFSFKTDINAMNPCVVLKRLEFDKDKRRIANSVLSQVPGLNDLQMIRPSSVDRIVQVVQVPGARSISNTPISNTQTSTQITPHIQRIGQPRTEKPLPSDSEVPVDNTTVATSLTTTSTTDSPTLINILSQQIIRPANQNNIKPRSSPLINILSQQIIKPASSVSNSKVTSTSSATEVQVNSIPRVIPGGDQIINQLINQARTPAPTLKTIVNSAGPEQNRILQFICKSSDGKLIPVTSFTSNKVVKVSMAQTANTSVSGTEENSGKAIQNSFKAKSEPSSEGLDMLPKFQQAFGKSAYQNNVKSSESTGSNSETINSDTEKSANVKNQSKNSSASLNVQPVQGGVIYTRQVPVGQTINLIPPGRGQVFRIATSNPEQLSLVKDSVIQGKMSALLAAALQGKQRTLENSEGDGNSEDDSQASTRVTLTARSPIVQNARIVKPVLQIPSNVIRSTPPSNLSSTTLEQLREFDMVYKQVKERSSTNAPTESSPQSDSNDTPQQISVAYVNQGQKINCAPVVVVSSYCNVQPAASPSLSVTSQGSSSPCVTPAPTLTLSSKAPTKSPKSKAIKSTTPHTTKASPIPKPQQKPQEDEHTTQRIFDILAEYAEQLRNSPDLNNKPAPRRRSNPPTNPNQNTKRKKGSSSKKTGQSSNSLASDGDIDDTHTVGSEDSSCGVVQISVQDEEQALATVNASENSEASASPKQLIITDSVPNQSHSLIIADSNVGEALKMSNTAVLVPGNYIMPVSMVKGGQQIAVVSGGSKILATVPARSGPNMLLFQSFLNQTRKHTIPTVKYSTLQPLSGIARNISGMPSQSGTNVTPTTTQNLTTVTLSPSVGLPKVNQMDRVEVNNFDTAEVYLAISQPQDTKLSSQHQQDDQSVTTPKILETDKDIIKSESSYDEGGKEMPNSSVATSVIAQATVIKEEISEAQSTTQGTMMALNLNTSDNDKDATLKVEERVQSVLVTTGTSNGPMLSHNPPTYKQVHSINSISESNKDEYLHNEGKHVSGDVKSSPISSYQNKIRKSHHTTSQRHDREMHQLNLQRKAAIERELRLQKSLSEECEDLGVDEPSASDLFPEADLPFDSGHSPSFDQTSQDLIKRVTAVQEVKEETRTIGIFCDDEPMRTDFLFEPIEYQPSSVDLAYDHAKEIRNGQNSSLPTEDSTLLQTCTTMSDVTIPSPISPEPYADLSPLTFNKRKYSYSNRKKLERTKQPENWCTELSSSEDTTGSTELVGSMTRSSPEPFSTKSLNSTDELYEFAIVERLPLKDDQVCQNLDCEAVAECPSGRGCRRSVKKTCSCCNLTVKVARKRPASRPTTPVKKTVTAKKR